jgi:hypothetical protein
LPTYGVLFALALALPLFLLLFHEQAPLLHKKLRIGIKLMNK